MGKKKTKDSLSAEERISKGDQAQTILDNPVIQEVFEKLESGYINAWISSGLGDSAKREQTYLLLRVLEEFKFEINSMITSGRFAKN
jgi:hypothetical protein